MTGHNNWINVCPKNVNQASLAKMDAKALSFTYIVIQYGIVRQNDKDLLLSISIWLQLKSQLHAMNLIFNKLYIILYLLKYANSFGDF